MGSIHPTCGRRQRHMVWQALKCLSVACNAFINGNAWGAEETVPAAWH